MKRTIYFSIIISQLLFVICLPVFYQLFSYLHPVVIVVVWMCLTAVVTFSVFLIRKEAITIPWWLVNALMIIYSLCLVILLFIRPNGQVYDNWNLTPFSTISFFLAGNVAPLVAFYNLAANIGLFIPYGLVTMMWRNSKLIQFLLPFFFISMIELLQYITKRGSLDIDDLILNMIGVYIGYLLSPIFQRVVRIGRL